jgi:CotH kinase protein
MHPLRTSLYTIFAAATVAFAQEPANSPAADRPPPGGPPDGFRGGPPMQPEVKLVAKFDQNDDKRLDAAERKSAREYLVKERAEGRLGRGMGPGGRGGRGGFGGPPPGADGPPPASPGGVVGPDGRPGFSPERRENRPPPEPGVKLSPADVKTYRAMPLYDTQTLRTYFLDFENTDWEKELMDFHGTDVEVPAKLTVDGKTYEDVGVYFRGASSFGVGEGRKHSINLSIDFSDEDQRLDGYRTINLLNSSGDPTLLCAVLYHQIAREYIASPKANWARVAVNGESWGVFVNVQQFNKDFVKEWFGSKKGARWKAPGRPNGNSGLEFLGDDVAEYKRRFEIKSKDDEESWTALIELCRVLNQTPAEQIEEKLAPLLYIDGTLKFLALENVFINTDGYWTRASDYSLYRDEDGRFHIIPHDVNETFRAAGGGPGGPRGPGGGGGAGGRGVGLDPLTGADDAKKPLLSKLLAVPALRTRYLGYVREIASTWLDWNKLGPIAQQYQAFLADEVKADTRKLGSYEAFVNGLAGEQTTEQPDRGRGRGMSLKSFAEQRRAYLLAHPEIQKLAAAPSTEAAQK